MKKKVMAENKMAMQIEDVEHDERGLMYGESGKGENTK